MQRVVAPVKAVVGASGFVRARIALAVFLGHSGQVKNGQQVQIGHARMGQRLQMLHALRGGLCEGQILASLLCRHCLIVDRKVAHMQFINDHVRWMLHALGDGMRVPIGRF